MDKLININTTVIQNKDVPVKDYDGEKSMVNMKKEKCFIMNKVGTTIWDMTSSPIEVEEIVSNLVKQYDMDYESCKARVLEFLNMLNKEQIIIKLKA